MAAHGKDQDFHLDNAAGSLTDLHSYLTGDGCNLEQVISEHETTVAGVNSKTFIIGHDEGNFSCTFEYNTTLVAHLQGIKRGLSSGGSVSFKFGPAGSASGAIRYTGECFVTKIGAASPVGDLVAFTADFRVTGTITQDTY